MVADLKRGGSFRRPHHHEHGEASRRRESVLRLGGEVQQEEGEERIGEPLNRRRTMQNTNDEPIPGGRGRSLSGTMVELWRGLRRGSIGEDEEMPEER